MYTNKHYQGQIRYRVPDGKLPQPSLVSFILVLTTLASNRDVIKIYGSTRTINVTSAKWIRFVSRNHYSVVCAPNWWLCPVQFHPYQVSGRGGKLCFLVRSFDYPQHTDCNLLWVVTAAVTVSCMITSTPTTLMGRWEDKFLSYHGYLRSSDFFLFLIELWWLIQFRGFITIRRAAHIGLNLIKSRLSLPRQSHLDV